MKDPAQLPVDQSNIGFAGLPAEALNGGVHLNMPQMPHAALDGGALILQQALSTVELTTLKFELFFLVLVRVSFIVFLLPFLNNMNVGNMAKSGLSFFVALCIFPTLDVHQIAVMPGAGYLLYLVIRECMVGAIVGFVGYFLFAFVEFGAEIINREIGLNAMPIIDPASGEYSTELTQVIVMTFSILFLISGGHTVLFEAVQESFNYIPLGGLRYQAQPIAWAMTTMVSESILYGFRFAAPVFVCMMLLALGMAFMSRVMPQMNIWVVSVPIKVVVGIMTLIYALPLMFKLFGLVFARVHQYLLLMLKLAGGG